MALLLLNAGKNICFCISVHIICIFVHVVAYTVHVSHISAYSCIFQSYPFLLALFSADLVLFQQALQRLNSSLPAKTFGSTQFGRRRGRLAARWPCPVHRRARTCPRQDPPYVWPLPPLFNIAAPIGVPNHPGMASCLQYQLLLPQPRRPAAGFRAAKYAFHPAASCLVPFLLVPRSDFAEPFRSLLPSHGQVTAGWPSRVLHRAWR